MSQSEGKKIYIQEMDKATRERWTSLFGSKDWVFYGDVKFVSSPKFFNNLKTIEDMELYPDDLWIASYPRSGTTWTQEIAWLINNNMDFEKARRSYLGERYAFIDCGIKLSEEELQNAPMFVREMAKAYPLISTYTRPRHIKTHLHMSLLPPILKTSKVIYVARNPLDAVVSNYHHNKLFKNLGYSGDFKSYWQIFTQGLTPFSPYFPHLKEAWALRDHPNMLFMFYEDMKKDINVSVRKIAKFLGKEYTDEQFTKLCEHVQFDNMKNNNTLTKDATLNENFVNVNEQSFLRKGKVGGWRDYFDEEMTKEAETWIQDNLKDTDLKFPPY